MRAIPIGQRVRARLAAVAAAAALLVAAVACTTAAVGPGQSPPGQSPSPRHRAPARDRPARRQGASQGQGTGLVVATAGGTVRGKAVAAAAEFLGIPYAAPPVGALRWQPPHPAAPGLASAGHQLRAALPAAGVAVRRGQHVGELPLPERVHPRRQHRPQPAGDGLGARRLAAHRRERRLQPGRAGRSTASSWSPSTTASAPSAFSPTRRWPAARAARPVTTG